jgi:26S proteasome regulatory subunit N1
VEDCRQLLLGPGCRRVAYCRFCVFSDRAPSLPAAYPLVIQPAEGRQPQGPAVDSARQNLASTLVNALVNAGFGTDKLVTPSSEGSSADNGARARRGRGLDGLPRFTAPLARAVQLSWCLTGLPPDSSDSPSGFPFAIAPSYNPSAVHWIFKNKDHGKTAATASLGLISLWDVEGGLPAIDK